jgi:predicted DNA-binding transcriptional regulator YafY
MKSSRLLEMLLLLQARGSVTAAELAERLEVSTRTVYRDADALSSAGVPIYTERGRGGGIRLLPGFRTDMSGLTRAEARALFVLTTRGAHADLGLAAPLRSAMAKVLRAVRHLSSLRLRRLASGFWWIRPAGSGHPKQSENSGRYSPRCSPAAGFGCGTGPAGSHKRATGWSTRTASCASPVSGT